MVCVLATAIAADVRDAAFVVVGGGHARVAVIASVQLAGGHQVREGGVCGWWGRGHAAVGVCWVV